MKYYIIAGERSGDLHGSNLIREIKSLDKMAQIRCWGGNYMEEAGGKLVVHYRELAVMGFLEVLANFRKISRFLDLCKKDIESFNPDVLVLIDFAGFNMRIAKFAKSRGLKVVYYISPKIWAWNQKRALKIKRYVDKMLVILPFEEEFYQQFNYKVDYVGNPLLDAVRSFQPNPGFLLENQLEQQQIIAVLPGSRKQEIFYILDTMLSIIPAFPEFTFVVAGVDNLPSEYYEKAMRHPQVKMVVNKTYDLLAHAHAAIVTSGTATLETALFEVPQVVCYRTSRLSYTIAKLLVKVKFISLVNLIAGNEVVKELIQDDFNVDNLSTELKKIIYPSQKRNDQIEGYRFIKKILGNSKSSEEAAKIIYEAVKG